MKLNLPNDIWEGYLPSYPVKVSIELSGKKPISQFDIVIVYDADRQYLKD
jgi:hypothetical protein